VGCLRPVDNVLEEQKTGHRSGSRWCPNAL